LWKDFATTFNAIAESAQEHLTLFLTLVNKTLRQKQITKSIQTLGFAEIEAK
jgi:hypothetical protein